MTPAARVAAAIEVFDAWTSTDVGLDRVLTQWGRTHRFAGSGDRHAIADLVYDAVRRRRSAAWVAGGGEDATGRTVLRGLLLLRGDEPGQIFSGDRHAPAPLTEAETRPARPLDGAPRAVRLDYPDALAAELAEVPDDLLAAMKDRAPLDLRVNQLKGDAQTAAARLAEDGIETAPGPLSPTCLRVTAGQRRVQRSAVYLSGLVEIQDAASQAVADLAAAHPGETVLDLCAGAGGKTLAMAAAMGGRGRLLAHDVAPARIAGLDDRARRAGATVEIVAPDRLTPLEGACDLVLVDAPCSGSGTWRRNPDAKWRLTMAELDRLATVQTGLLQQAFRLVRPGGRVVYATCSLFARENEDIVHAALADGWSPKKTLKLGPPDGGDGFFAAVLARAAPC